jgi:hypothetical protein
MPIFFKNCKNAVLFDNFIGITEFFIFGILKTFAVIQHAKFQHTVG